MTRSLAIGAALAALAAAGCSGGGGGGQSLARGGHVGAVQPLAERAIDATPVNPVPVDFRGSAYRGGA
jgi:hypothetical protein